MASHHLLSVPATVRAHGDSCGDATWSDADAAPLKEPNSCNCKAGNHPNLSQFHRPSSFKYITFVIFWNQWMKNTTGKDVGIAQCHQFVLQSSLQTVYYREMTGWYRLEGTLTWMNHVGTAKSGPVSGQEPGRCAKNNFDLVCAWITRLTAKRKHIESTASRALSISHNHTTLLRFCRQGNPTAQQLNFAFRGALLVRAFSLSISGTSACSHFSADSPLRKRTSRPYILVHAAKKRRESCSQTTFGRIAHTHRPPIPWQDKKIYIYIYKHTLQCITRCVYQHLPAHFSK